MIFTYQGYDTYIFDLDSKGKALVFKDGIIDLGSPSSPNCLGVIRLVDDKIMIDLTSQPTQSDHDVSKESYVINDGDMVQFGNNMLHLHLNYNSSGTLRGGTFILDTNNSEAGPQQERDNHSQETSNSRPQTPSGLQSQNSPAENELALATVEKVDGKPSASDQPSRQPEQDDDLYGKPDEKSNDGHLDSGNGANREKLDQIALETSIIERTSFASSDSSDSSDFKSKSKSEHSAHGSSSGSGSEKRERLDQIARETSVIEATFLSEKNHDAFSEPQPCSPSSSEHLLKTGEGFKEDLFAGGYEYVVYRFIGRGGFGEVYQIVDKQGNPYALKILNPAIIKEKGNISALFDNEVSIGRYLEFPTLVRTLESGFDVHHQLRYCIMTFIDGVNFSQVIAYMIKQGKCLHYLYATWIILKVAEVLKFLSANGVVHRDIKTQNVMLNRQGEIKVMDLGIARQRNDHSPLNPNEPLGTLSYLPMGHLLRRDPVDARLDIYCLGVMYFRLLTNKPPIPEPPHECASRIKYYREMTGNIYKNPAMAPDPRKIVSKIPVDVSQIVMKMMNQDIDKRYSNVQDLIDDLGKLVSIDDNTEKITAELGKLCANVIHLKPYKSPSYLPPRKKHVHRSMWVALLVFILLLSVSYSLKYIDEFNRNEAAFHELVAVKQKQADMKVLKHLENDLDSLMTGGTVNPMSWSAEQWKRWFGCKPKKTAIQGFLGKYNDLSRKANDVVWFMKKFYWVEETPKLWSSDEQKKFNAIQNRMNYISEEIKKHDGKLKTNIEN